MTFRTLFKTVTIALINIFLFSLLTIQCFAETPEPIFMVDFPQFYSSIATGDNTATVTKDYIEDGVKCLMVVPNLDYNSSVGNDIVLDTYINIKTYPDGFAAGNIFAKAKYAAVKYKYVCPDGEGAAQNMAISITRNGGILESSATNIISINSPVKNEWSYAYFNISDVAANAIETGVFRQIHITPLGKGVKPNMTVEGEKIYIGEVLFYEQNPVMNTEYSITIDPGVENGSVSADKDAAAAGEKIILTITPDDGYEIEAITYYDGFVDVEIKDVGGIYSFEMPESNVTVKVFFTESSNDPEKPAFIIDFPKFYSSIATGDNTATVTKDYIKDGINCVKVVPNLDYNSSAGNDITLDTYIDIQTYPNGFASGRDFAKVKYAAIKYKYVCPDGVFGTAEEMQIKGNSDYV